VSASVDRQAETPAIETPAPQTADATRPQPADRKSKSTELIVMAVVIAVVAIGGGWFLMSQKAEQAAVDDFLLNVNRGKTEAVEKALASSVPLDVNQTDADGRSALTIATEMGHADIVELMLSDPGVRIDVDENGVPKGLFSSNQAVVAAFAVSPRLDLETGALIEMVHEQNAEAVRLLLSRSDIDVNYAPEAWQGTPLLHALGFKDQDIAGMLLAHPDIDVNKRSMFEGRWGDAPLAYAIKGVSTMDDPDWAAEAIETLLSHPDIDVNGRGTNSWNWTALHYAVTGQHTAKYVPKLLARPEIDLSARSGHGKTALGHALEKLAQQDAYTPYTPEHPSYNAENATVVRLLREAGATE
jgi:ankyrin repeat protein